MRFQKNVLVLLCFVLLSGFGVLAQNPPSSFVILNEMQTNNPGTDITDCEYIEIRGDFNSTVPATLHLLEVEGDGTGAGTVDFVRNIAFDSIGSNGIAAYTGVSAPTFGRKGLAPTPCDGRDYADAGGIHTPDPTMTLENGTISFLLVSFPTVSVGVGTDLDTNNDGVIDNLPGDAVIVDAVGWSDGGGSDFVYGGVNVTPGNTSGAPDAATRNFFNLLPLDSAAWFADDIANTGSANSLHYDLTNLGGYMIDFITPGRQNLAPTAAGVSIQGRVTDVKGRGLSRVGVVLAGGSLDGPVTVMTNQFGVFRFEGISAGDTYLLQVISGRHSFDTPVRSINVNGSIAGITFVGQPK